jgi:hypothetical protein
VEIFKFDINIFVFLHSLNPYEMLALRAMHGCYSIPKKTLAIF